MSIDGGRAVVIILFWAIFAFIIFTQTERGFIASRAGKIERAKDPAVFKLAARFYYAVIALMCVFSLWVGAIKS